MQKIQFSLKWKLIELDCGFMEFEYLTQAIEVVACQIRGEFLKKLIEENTNHFFENK